MERWLFSTDFHGRRRDRGIEGRESQFRARISESCRQRDTYAHEVDREKHSYVMARDCDRSCECVLRDRDCFASRRACKT